MAIKLKTLLIHSNIFNDVYVTVKPTLVVKSEIEGVKVFSQRYNVEVKSDEGEFNYESECELDIEKPTYSQCYEHLKTQSEFKTAENV